MSTPKDAPYKQLQALKPQTRVIATSPELSAYQKANGHSALETASGKVKRLWRTLSEEKKRAVLRAIAGGEAAVNEICQQLGVQPEHVRAARKILEADIRWGFSGDRMTGDQVPLDDEQPDPPHIPKRCA